MLSVMSLSGAMFSLLPSSGPDCIAVGSSGDEILYGRHQRREKPSVFVDQLAEELQQLNHGERSVLKILYAAHQTGVKLSSTGIAQILHGDSICAGDREHLTVSQDLFHLQAYGWARLLSQVGNGPENHLWSLDTDGIKAAERLGTG